MTEELEPPATGEGLLIGSEAEPEKVTQLVVGATKFGGRSWALEPAHRTLSAFEAR
jgi:hypothetical protein